MSVCPRCQAPYGPGARFCQQCGAALADAEPVNPGPDATRGPSEPPLQKVNPRLLALLGGAGLLVIIAAIFLLMRSGEPPPGTGPTPSPDAATPEAALQQHLGQVLGTLREAQISKDIARLMDCYAAGFPGREEKRQAALKAWTEFDFTAMFFYLEEVKPTGPTAAQGRVTWDLQVQDKRTQEISTATQTFQVEFVKEQGTWRIRSLQEISTP